MYAQHNSKKKDTYEAGFTLIEMLAVIGIIVLLMAVLIPSIGSLTSNYEVTRNGQLLNDNLVLARQLATTQNHDSQLRFFTTGDSEPKWVMQLWEYHPKDGTWSANSKRSALPDSVIVNMDLSPLLENSAITGTEKGETYYGIQFGANGRLAGQVDNATNYITLQLRRADRAKPDNYYTVQINPVTGKVSTYRP